MKNNKTKLNISSWFVLLLTTFLFTFCFSNANNNSQNVQSPPNPSWVKVIETNGFLEVTEGGATSSYDMVLPSAPSGTVVVNIISTDTTTGVAINLSSVTFDAANWDIPQTVTVTAVDDPVAEGEKVTNITLSLDTNLTDDPDYLQLAGSDVTVSANVIDNDAGIVLIDIGDALAVEGGSNASYSIQLSVVPVDTVVVLVTSLDTVNGADVSPPSLSFDAGNWNTPQTVTVTAIDDNILEGPATVDIAHDIDTGLTLDASYDGAAGALPVKTLSVDDNEVIAALSALIITAQDLISVSVEGAGLGQYPAEAFNALSTSITLAQTAIDNQGAITGVELYAAYTNLLRFVDAFKASKNKAWTTPIAIATNFSRMAKIGIGTNDNAMIVTGEAGTNVNVVARTLNMETGALGTETTLDTGLYHPQVGGVQGLNNGGFLAYWGYYDSVATKYFLRWSIYNGQSGTWSAPSTFNMSYDAMMGFRVRSLINGKGDVYLCNPDNINDGYKPYLAIYNASSQTWSENPIANQGGYLSCIIDKNDNLHVRYSWSSTVYNNIRYADGTWGTPTSYVLPAGVYVAMNSSIQPFLMDKNENILDFGFEGGGCGSRLPYANYFDKSLNSWTGTTAVSAISNGCGSQGYTGVVDKDDNFFIGYRVNQSPAGPENTQLFMNTFDSGTKQWLGESAVVTMPGITVPIQMVIDAADGLHYLYASYNGVKYQNYVISRLSGNWNAQTLFDSGNGKMNMWANDIQINSVGNIVITWDEYTSGQSDYTSYISILKP